MSGFEADQIRGTKPCRPSGGGIHRRELGGGDAELHTVARSIVVKAWNRRTAARRNVIVLHVITELPLKKQDARETQ
jgi:hypothetical protein